MQQSELDRDNLWEITLVFTPSMTPGKACGQAFQAALRWTQRDMDATVYLKLRDWLDGGTRTIVRYAKTPAMFQRVCEEVPGYVMVDEGFTEVDPGTATLFVSEPYLHKDRPPLLNGKKVPLL